MSKKKPTGERSGKQRIPWHPAFCAAAEFDLRENKKDLIYESELELNKEPLKMDLLIIKKRKNAVIKNEIGHFFRGFNILEYKGPGSALTLNDLFKTLSYTYLYKSLEESPNAIPADELTVSLLREAYPRKLMTDLSKLGITAAQTAPGIYTLTESSFFAPVQIVVTKDLRPETGTAMRILSKKLELLDLETFFQAAENAKDPDDINNIGAILYASGRANQEVFKQTMEVITMPEFFEELLKDQFEARDARIRKESKAEGRKEGKAEAAREYEVQLNALKAENEKLKAMLA